MDILSFDKLLYHPDKVDRLRRNERQFPVHVTLSLGNYCNHRCLWCTAYEYQLSKAKHMDYDKLMSFIERASKRGLKAVGYVGNGEPLAYPKFRELSAAVNALGLQQGMFTNGYLLDRYMDEALNHFTYIRFSLDAGSPETHAAMHDVANQYERIIDNAAALIAQRRNKLPTVGIQFATHHLNMHDLPASAKMASEIGVDYFSVKPVFNRGSVGERIEKNNLTFDELTPMVAEIRRQYESPDFKIYYRPHQIMSEAADRNILNYGRCVAGFFNLNVYEDEKLVYCGPNRIPVGTLDDDLDDVEDRIMKLSTRLDLSKCPAGCRYHALNHLADTLVDPDQAAPYHPNFL